MKRNMIPKIIFLVLLIILIVMVVILIISQKAKALTALMYNDICEKEKYYFSVKEINSELDNSLIVSRNDGSICIDSTSNEEHTSTLVNETDGYFIMHNEKEYYFYDMNEIDADILKNELSCIKEQEYKSGYEKIEGQKYYYEEFEGITTFIMTLSYNEESDIKTRFYYDKNKIAYIKNIVNNEEELLKAEFSDTIDENLFKIPDDYAEI